MCCDAWLVGFPYRLHLSCPTSSYSSPTRAPHSHPTLLSAAFWTHPAPLSWAYVASAVTRGSALESCSVVAILNFLIILYFDLCFVSEVSWENGSCAGGLEPWFTCGPTYCCFPTHLPRTDSQPLIQLSLAWAWWGHWEN